MARQAAERLAAGSCYRVGEDVVTNEVGERYHPQVHVHLARAVRHLKSLAHDAEDLGC
jgi:hypothetical protein